jgi:hypothetical protein
MFLEAAKKGLIFFLGVTMPRATTGLLERLLDSKLCKLRSAFTMSGFCLRLAARWNGVLITGGTSLGLLVVLWTTDTKTIFQIQGSPTIEAVLLVSQNLRPATDSKSGHAFEKIGSLIFGPFVLGLLAWLPLASGLLGGQRLMIRQACACRISSIEHGSRFPRFWDLDIGLFCGLPGLPGLFNAD